MNEPPGARARVALSALTIAEYFRDDEEQDVLLFIDNIFRFTQAGSEVSALLGRIPSAVGYQPTLATEMGALQERITSTKKGSITSVQAIYVPADDLTDPAPATAFAHLDATTVLNRAITEIGIYPAVDPLDSTSRILDPHVVGDEHYEVAREVQRTLQRYKDLQDIIAILGMDELSEDDKLTVARPQDPALPLAAVLRRRAVHRHPRASTSSSRTRSAASRRSSTASTTTSPSRPSTWWAASRRRSRRPRSWPCGVTDGAHPRHRHARAARPVRHRRRGPRPGRPSGFGILRLRPRALHDRARRRAGSPTSRRPTSTGHIERGGRRRVPAGGRGIRVTSCIADTAERAASRPDHLPGARPREEPSRRRRAGSSS